jgi:hypothetical protein
LNSAETLRLDPEYFQKSHLYDESIVESRNAEFKLFKDFKLTVDASAFYPSTEPYYDTGELPFLRVADVDAVINMEQCTTIPIDLCTQFPTLKKVYPGDIILTKGGSVARIGLVTKEAAACRDLIFINSSTLPETEQVFLYLYFQTDFCNRWLIRSSSQTAQPHLTITLVRNLPIFTASDTFKQQCVKMVEKSYKQRNESISTNKQAEQTLLRALGLENWQPPEPLTYTRRASEAFAAGRLDAQFFDPRVDDLLDSIGKSFSLITLSDTGEVLKGITVPYHQDGTIPIIRSGDLKDIQDEISFLRTLPTEQIFDLQAGDVLISSIGFGSIGKVQVFDKPGRYGTVSEVTVVRQQTLNPYYLMSFLRSFAGQDQFERFITGATGQLHLYPKDVGKIMVPLLPKDIQNKFESFALEATAARRQAHALLDAAKRAVEIAIEHNEQAALEYLAAFNKKAR